MFSIGEEYLDYRVGLGSWIILVIQMPISSFVKVNFQSGSHILLFCGSAVLKLSQLDADERQTKFQRLRIA